MEPFGAIGSLDDFDFDARRHAGQAVAELRTLISPIGEQLCQERVQPEHRCHHHDPAIAVLNVGSLDDGVQQQAQSVYEYMAFLAFDLLARIIAMRIVEPPFSALFTLWLSITAAVGLASRPSCSRQAT